MDLKNFWDSTNTTTNEYHRNSIITVGLRWNGHHWISFHIAAFHWQFDVVNHAVLTWKFFKLYTHECYVWGWTTQLWHLSPHISRTCVTPSNIVFESFYAPHAGHGRVWSLRITMVPLFTQPHTIALTPSDEKSFTTYLSRKGWPMY